MIYFETGFTGITYDLNHPRICGLNRLKIATLTASHEDVGFEAVNLLSETTYDAYQTEAIQTTVEFNLKAQFTLSYMGITAHTIGSSGSTVQWQYFDGSVWVDIGPLIDPADDSDILLLHAPVSAQNFRIVCNSGPCLIGVIYAGAVIEVPQQVYVSPQTPVDLAIQTEYRTNRSARGQWVGRSIQRQRNVNTVPIEHVEETWVRSVLLPFIEDAREYPYFFAERPQDYPTAVSYKWQDNDILPQRMGISDRMRFEL